MKLSASQQQVVDTIKINGAVYRDNDNYRYYARLNNGLMFNIKTTTVNALFDRRVVGLEDAQLPDGRNGKRVVLTEKGMAL